jgi:hypothetical protein
MGSLSKTLSPMLTSWFESLARKMQPNLIDRFDKPTKYAAGKDPESLIEQAGEKAKSLEEKAPEFFDMIEAKDLYSGLKRAQSGETAMGLINPSDFRKIAAPLPDDAPAGAVERRFGYNESMDLVNKNVEKIEDLIRDKILLGDAMGSGVPELGLENIDNKLLQARFHEGRHRNRALKNLGYDKSLVELLPSTYAGDVVTYKPDVEQFLNLKKDTPIYSEMRDSALTTYKEPENVGTLGDLIKFLSVSGIATKGALSQLPEE